MDTAIETHQLTKRYGAVTAVSNLSLQVIRGEIYGFLGLNGAGKSTTIRMLLGMVRPTAGEARVLGSNLQLREKKPWDSVGYLVETPHAYPELTVRENLEIMVALRPGTGLRSVDRIIERLGLGSYANRRAGTLSRGNAQRLGLAQALIHEPTLLILDEPANGLDPAGIVEIRNLFIRLARERGVTIFMSSHILGEVARLAHRIGILHQGQLLRELSIADLHQDRRRTLKLRARDIRAAQRLLAGAGYPAEIKAQDLLEVSGRLAVEKPDAIARLLAEGGHPPAMLYVEEEDLEDYFMRLVGNLAEKAA